MAAPSQGTPQAQVQPPGLPVPDSDLAPVLAQLNLTAVKNRAMELYASIGRLRDVFQPQYAGALRWPDILNQFAVLNTQLLNLVADMKPILRMFVVYPKAGGVGPETAPILPLMLSTKLLPEMEAERASLQEQLETKMGLTTPQRGGQPAQIPPPVQAQISRLQQQIETIRSACDAANRTIQAGRRTLSQHAASAYQPPAKPDPALVEKERLLRNAVLSGEGLKVANNAHPPKALPPHLAKVLAPSGGGPSSPRGGRPPLPSLRPGGSGFAVPMSPPGGSGGKAQGFKLPSPRVPSPYAAGSPRSAAQKPF
ncbi:Mediator subunit 8 [Klebsormidium nitens]|uniref:Mediator subunit 8 n=1 Tax=Klebsormidium nitens TaxID=105231 RepID=A0A1Y1HQC2_KLENI|nr:Mediator subunit 8 [Klebsormidium nitens]|eukprot:GAQ78786.1 Mediator subunit 8 [Klebsormidium nitens]